MQLIVNKPTRRETEMILRRIPSLDWESFADLFRPDGEFAGPVDLDAFAFIADPNDRKFAALGAAVRRPLVTSDNDFLVHRNMIPIEVFTPDDKHAAVGNGLRAACIGQHREQLRLDLPADWRWPLFW